MHELTVTARQLASVVQLVRARHRNRRTAGSIPAKGPTILAKIIAEIDIPALPNTYAQKQQFLNSPSPGSVLKAYKFVCLKFCEIYIKTNIAAGGGAGQPKTPTCVCD